jgi:hypothetical protein
MHSRAQSHTVLPVDQACSLRAMYSASVTRVDTVRVLAGRRLDDFATLANSVICALTAPPGAYGAYTTVDRHQRISFKICE